MSEPVADVVADGEVGKERRLLKHHADATLLRRPPPLPRHVAPDVGAESNRAFIRTFEPGNLAQDRRLSRPRRTEQDEHRARKELDLERRGQIESAGEPLPGPHGEQPAWIRRHCRGRIHTVRCNAYVNARMTNETTSNSSDVRDAAA